MFIPLGVDKMQSHAIALYTAEDIVASGGFT